MNVWGERVRERRDRIGEAGARPVSGASAAVFRIAFGLAMCVNALLYLPQLVSEYYVGMTFTFGYPPFAFIEPLPGIGMHLVFGAMGILGLLIAAGLWYRAACTVFCALNTYVFLLDSTVYQNHEYLISLLSFLMIFMPLHRMWSVDARRRPELAAPTVPARVVWLLRFQIGVPYFFGGVAKLNTDWFQGEPLRMWLAERTHIPLVGPFLTEEPVVWFAVYGSLVLDLTVVGFLLHPRTRPIAFVVVACFHLINARLFGLFVFPWLMIAATTLFFRPDWPQRLGRRWSGQTQGTASTAPAAEAPPRPAAPRVSRPLTACLTLWVAVQLLLPLRHFALPGTVSWTEEGHRFSWHMMLRTKQSGAIFTVTDGERTWRVDSSEYLSPKQEARMAGHPERIVLFAHYLSEQHDGAEIRVATSVSLNGRGRVPLIDPTVDLSQVTVPWRGHAEWILPLDEPLRR